MSIRVHIGSDARQEVAMVNSAPVLAADIGGTHSRLSIISRIDRTARPLAVARYKKFLNADYRSFAEILEEFLDGIDVTTIGGASIASAGYFLGDDLVAANVPVKLSLADVRQALSLKQVTALNDFVAVAYGTQYLNPADVVMMNRKAVRPERGAVAVLGPGTGLGAAVLMQGPGAPAALNTEAGQAAFAPETPLEVELLKVLQKRFGFVNIERTLSGPGLMNIYSALAEIKGRGASLQTPEEVSKAAVDEDDPEAAEALSLFCERLGSTAGDLALMYGATGGMYLAGGILPQIREFLLESNFMERFKAKGEMRPYLERIPVNLIEHGQLGVIGAAGWYMDSLSCA